MVVFLSQTNKETHIVMSTYPFLPVSFASRFCMVTLRLPPTSETKSCRNARRRSKKIREKKQGQSILYLRQNKIRVLCHPSSLIVKNVSWHRGKVASELGESKVVDTLCSLFS